MLGLDVCEFGGQLLELMWLTVCYRGIMADKEAEKPIGEEEETDLNYQPPAQKSLQEIQELDKEDESLNKYKQALLGAGPVIAGDLEALKKQNFVLMEGVDYRVKIHFKVGFEARSNQTSNSHA
ncbi:Rho GDP-dissociation inhibitor 3 [Acipenser ruthenus]|uniref:Rho GDP-dissociation inhibitor 3 n=1 Tax=Acipenser ruthenus TaxID=7906 RepID=A0A444TYH6_ACIRT|nr:Rho GDP-dissociation inhibitor 3 [Acipenser ruthenus]